MELMRISTTGEPRKPSNRLLFDWFFSAIFRFYFTLIWNI